MIEAGTFDLRIDSIAAGGDGVGRLDGMVVFVPRTAPGDLARVRARQEGRLMRGSMLELIEASPERIDAPCDHYRSDRCGGCQIQHLGYEAQLRAKAGIIRDSLTRIGRVTVDAPDVEPSPKPWRYRRKLTLALRQRGSQRIAGLHRFDAPEEVFELKDCPITDERVLGAWSKVLEQESLLPRENQLRGAVRLLDAGFSFTLESEGTWSTHEEFFGAIPEMMELWWSPEGKRRRLQHSRAGQQHAGASFAQVNPEVARSLRAWVLQLASAVDPQTAVDAYSGSGDLSADLAARGVSVTAIEVDRDSARLCASRLPSTSRVIAKPVEDALAGALPADLVILNPPRAGVDARVTAALSRTGGRPRAVIYVSCNPATLARDVGRLEPYRLRSLRGFDMFPQTAHVETVCELVPHE